MKVALPLSNAFGADFEALIARFAVERELLPSVEDLSSPRYLSRSVVPHVTKLSSLFNRTRDLEHPPQTQGLGPYWKQSSNPAHLRLAYFLYFMPSNLFRMASVWNELSRLGYRWNAKGALRALELGAGPAAGAAGIAAGEHFGPVGLPREGDFALIEQDRAMLELGSAWALRYFESLGQSWGTRPFHRKLSLQEGLLPRAAPRFNLWMSSFFLNELEESPAEIAEALLSAWERHLDDEGLVILVEPALQGISRKLLEVRRELLALRERRAPWLQLLLPCLGHQACGALAAPGDWCHEEVSWWRPAYFRAIDKMAGLDRKTLPFSYLVFARSKRSRSEILPELAQAKRLHRLVSPAHSEGKEREFFVCGEEGKRRARYRPTGENDPASEIGRGDILEDAEVRGDVNAGRISRFSRLK